MANQHGDALAVSTVLGPGDVAIIVSYSGTLVNQFGTELKLVFERGIKAIAVTANERLGDQLAGIECMLTCSTGEINRRVGQSDRRFSSHTSHKKSLPVRGS
jgi:hypothetical protein